MKICVYGLWHLGTVTAACLASKGFDVTGLDGEAQTIDNLNEGAPPLFEPGLEEMVKNGLSKGNLRFSADKARVVKECDVIWVAFDTPVDEEDRADTEYVVKEVQAILTFLKPGTDVLISSQLPVGTTFKLEKSCAQLNPDSRVNFYYSPENLRLGKAIDAFTNPARIVIGKREEADSGRIEQILTSFCENIEWMSVESAEMTKHALNAFLATSVTFINELAELCEQVGADAKEVERGLKSEPRIGQKAYLGPGSAFAGGTLARDIEFLKALGKNLNVPVHLFPAVRESNDAHKTWPRRKLKSLLGILKGETIAVLGLTYKPGTDTLRRSSAIELCRWLREEGTLVKGHDPAVKKLPESLQKILTLEKSVEDVVRGASALVLATEWPEYKNLDGRDLVQLMKKPVIIDPNGFLNDTFSQNPDMKYAAVGKP